MSSIAMIVPVVAQLLTLSVKIADIVQQSADVSIEDKAALKAAIEQAKNGVTHWNEEDN